MTITTAILLTVYSIIIYSIGNVRGVLNLTKILASTDEKHSKIKKRFEKLIKSFELKNTDYNKMYEV